MFRTSPFSAGIVKISPRASATTRRPVGDSAKGLVTAHHELNRVVPEVRAVSLVGFSITHVGSSMRVNESEGGSVWPSLSSVDTCYAAFAA